MIYAFDVSGSTTAEQLAAMEAFMIGRGDATLVLGFDTRVLTVQKPTDGLPRVGGGGTDPQCVINWVAANEPSEEVMIISDGMFFTPKPKGVRAHLALLPSFEYNQRIGDPFLTVQTIPAK